MPTSPVLARFRTGGQGRWLGYEDDGVSLEHERGAFREREIVHRSTRNRGRLEFSGMRGMGGAEVKRWRIFLHGLDRPVRVLDGDRSVQGHGRAASAVPSFEVPNRPEPFTVSWRPE